MQVSQTMAEAPLAWGSGADAFAKAAMTSICFSRGEVVTEAHPSLYEGDGSEANGGTPKTPEALADPPPVLGKAILMAGERELTTGLLAKGASFRLIMTGNIGVKEIEGLI
jgi:hypothetical protein